MPIFNDPGMDRLVSLVSSRLGLSIDEHNKNHWDEVIRRRLALIDCSSVTAYSERLNNPDFSPREFRELALELTVGETYFFRHPEHFKVLAEVAVRERLRVRDTSCRLNILSAGCASGEETYSLAAVVRPLIPSHAHWDVRIWGIDINTDLLNKAVRATYTEWSLRAVSEQERLCYFHPAGREYAVNDNLRTMVTFQERNLVEDDPDFWKADFFDIVFWRNVMMYFAPPVVRKMLDRLARCLSPGGYLFVGPSETLRGLTHAFHLRHTHGAFYYQRTYPGEPVALPFTAGGAFMDSKVAPRTSAGEEKSWVDAVADANRRIADLAYESGQQQRAASNVPAPDQRAAEPAVTMLERVRELLRSEQFTEALRILRTLPPEATNNSEALMLEAVLLTNTGDLESAKETCRRLLEIDELNADAHYLTAVCLEHGGQYLAAAEEDQTAAYLDPAFAMPRLHLGLLTKRLGDSTTAQRELQEAVRLLPHEDQSRISLFGGGFEREALVRLCRSHWESCGGTS